MWCRYWDSSLSTQWSLKRNIDKPRHLRSSEDGAVLPVFAEHFGQKLQGDFDCSGFSDHPHALRRQEETELMFAPGSDVCIRNRYWQASPPSGVSGCGAGRRLCWTAGTVGPCPPETCNLHHSTSVISSSQLFLWRRSRHSPLSRSSSSNSARGTNAVLSRTPQHPDTVLCCLTHAKLHSRPNN